MNISLLRGHGRSLTARSARALAPLALCATMAHEMAMPPANKGAMFDVVTSFINTPGMTPKQAAEKMAAAGKR